MIPGTDIKMITIGPGGKPMLPMGLGGSWFVPYSAPSEGDGELIDAMSGVYDAGIRHFDTGAGYGGGHSEELYGQFLKHRRDEVFLASKATPAAWTAEAMVEQIDGSLRRLRTDRIDLYYIHWPDPNADMRPAMEGLESARAAGKIQAVGVSNFSVGEMQQVAEVGTIDAHQLAYNLLWRFAEDEVMPYCAEHGIAVVSYSTLAHGILTGKFDRDPGLRAGDQRHRILPFRQDIWPHVYQGVEAMKVVAAEVERPLMHLAARWAIARQAMTTVLVGARNRQQATANVAALEGEIPSAVFDRLTAIGDDIARFMPHAHNVFGRPR